MKKRILVVAMLLMVCALGMAVAETPPAVPKLGEGSVSIGVYVLAEQEEDGQMFEVATDEKSLLEALLKLEFIAGKEASWGFNVTTVNGVLADYDKDGSYWRIYAYNRELDEIEPLETAIGETPLQDGDLFLFVKEQ